MQPFAHQDVAGAQKSIARTCKINCKSPFAPEHLLSDANDLARHPVLARTYAPGRRWPVAKRANAGCKFFQRGKIGFVPSIKPCRHGSIPPNIAKNASTDCKEEAAKVLGPVSGERITSESITLITAIFGHARGILVLYNAALWHRSK